MESFETHRFRLQRAASSKKTRFSRNISNNRSPKRGTTLITKMKIIQTSIEHSPLTQTKSSRISQLKLTNLYKTPRASSRIRICTHSKSLKRGNTLASKIPEVQENDQLPYKLPIFLKKYREELTDYEIGEILQYDKIFFWGIFKDKNRDAISPQCFDDEDGSYLARRHDHIAYRFEVLKLLGRGSFGQVYKCFDHKTQEHVALKIIKTSKQHSSQAKNEIKILQLIASTQLESTLSTTSHKIDSPSELFVQILDSFTFRGHICIILELLSKNLYDVQKSKNYRSFPQSLLKKLSIQILNSLRFLRSLGIIHCDLKPENILLKTADKEGVKLVDFGSSCKLGEKIFTYIQSRFYRAPEVILRIGYSFPIDMWSFGCILAELAIGRPLFPADCEKELLKLIIQIKGEVPEEILKKSLRRNDLFSKGKVLRDDLGILGEPVSNKLEEVLPGGEIFVDFIEKCLEWDPDRRMKPEEALRHPWLSDNACQTKPKDYKIVRTFKKYKL